MSNGSIDGLISTLDIAADADYLFECFNMVTNGFTKSYLEAASTTLTQNNSSITIVRSAKDFHQHNRSIPMS